MRRPAGRPSSVLAGCASGFGKHAGFHPLRSILTGGLCVAWAILRLRQYAIVSAMDGATPTATAAVARHAHPPGLPGGKFTFSDDSGHINPQAMTDMMLKLFLL